MKIVITAPFAAQQVEELKGQHEVLFSPQDDSTPLRSEEQLHSLLAEERAEIFITESDRVTAQVLEGLDDLKLLCVCRTGLNNIDIPACTDHGVALVNAPGRNAAAVAHSLLICLDFSLRARSCCVAVSGMKAFITAFVGMNFTAILWPPLASVPFPRNWPNGFPVSA